MAVLHVAISVLAGTTGGPASYGRRLVAELAATGDLRLSVLTDRASVFDRVPGIELVELPMRGGLDRLRWQHVAVPRALRRLSPDVYHDTKNALPLGCRWPAVVTVHDLAYHTVPESFGFASRLFLRRATRHAIRLARAVIVPSQATGADLRRIHPQCANRIHVVPHGIDAAPTVSPDELAEVCRRLSLPRSYVLHVGTVQHRKNVDLLVQAVRTLRSGGLPHRALVIGRRGWLADRALAEIRRDDTAQWIEHVDQHDLAAIYAGAAAFASPSAYEGFGLAVADALAAGVPTIVSPCGSLPELCGDAAVVMARLDAEALAEALAGVLLDANRADDLRRRARRRADDFRWSDAAAGHRVAYRRALTG